MKIEIRRSGGFAGIEQLLASSDSGDWSAELAEDVGARVERVFRLAGAKPRPVGADQYRYEITTSEPGGETRRLVVADEGDPNEPALKEILGIIERIGPSPARAP